MKKHLTFLILIAGFAVMPLQADTPTQPAKSIEEPSPSVKTHATPPIFEDFKETEGKGDDRFMTEFLNMLATLGLLVALILTVTWILKRMLNTRIQQINDKSTIKILERRSLTPKSAIYLLDIQGKGFIVAESHMGITTLGTMELNGGETPVTHENVEFKKILEQKQSERERESERELK